jgi:hypothetical protein
VKGDNNKSQDDHQKMEQRSYSVSTMNANNNNRMLSEFSSLEQLNIHRVSKYDSINRNQTNTQSTVTSSHLVHPYIESGGQSLQNMQSNIYYSRQIPKNYNRSSLMLQKTPVKFEQ